MKKLMIMKMPMLTVLPPRQAAGIFLLTRAGPWDYETNPRWSQAFANLLRFIERYKKFCFYRLIVKKLVPTCCCNESCGSVSVFEVFRYSDNKRFSMAVGDAALENTNHRVTISYAHL